MIYVSLSTIPSRIKTINKSIDSLMNQSLKPDKIFLNIPTNFKRFKEIILDKDIPKLPDIVEINRCDDCGPGTKLLGSINKLKKNSLIVLADDDQIYEDYMLETFNKFYQKNPNNAYSFYVHPLGKFGIGQGADGFAINTNSLENINLFYDKIVKDNFELFLYDDLWISFFLFFIKKNKILSLHNFLKEDEMGKKKTIYVSHNDKSGLISTYAENLIDAVKERDKRAFISFKYMLDQMHNLKLDSF